VKPATLIASAACILAAGCATYSRTIVEKPVPVTTTTATAVPATTTTVYTEPAPATSTTTVYTTR
jgi:hypothetical protein